MIDGIYTVYMTGAAGQGIAMFVFKEGIIAGADMAGLTFSGTYSNKDGKVKGEIEYSMPAQSLSITGAAFEEPSGTIKIPLDLPTDIQPCETYRIATPIGPVNSKFVKNIDWSKQ